MYHRQSAKLQLRYNKDSIAMSAAAAIVSKQAAAAADLASSTAFSQSVDTHSHPVQGSCAMDTSDSTTDREKCTTGSRGAESKPDGTIAAQTFNDDGDGGGGGVSSSNGDSSSNTATIVQPTHPSSSAATTVAMASTPAPHTTVEVNTFQPFVRMTPEYCLEQLLQTNFDATSTPAALTLAKYLINILKAPHDHKYRTINTLNKVFREKVEPAKGSMEFLFSIGFRSDKPNVNALMQSYDAPGPGNHLSAGLASEWQVSSLVLKDTALDLTLLRRAWSALSSAMQELQVPVDQRPNLPSAPSAMPSNPALSQMTGTSHGPAPAPFDPFKASIVRNAAQVVCCAFCINDCLYIPVFRHPVFMICACFQNIHRRPFAD